jgi:hypothetical protein
MPTPFAPPVTNAVRPAKSFIGILRTKLLAVHGKE